MERTVRQFHKSPGMLDPDRGAAMIAEDFGFEDIARGETLGGNEVYKPDQHHWREAFPDGLCEAENVIVSQCGEILLACSPTRVLRDVPGDCRWPVRLLVRALEKGCPSEFREAAYWPWGGISSRVSRQRRFTCRAGSPRGISLRRLCCHLLPRRCPR